MLKIMYKSNLFLFYFLNLSKSKINFKNKNRKTLLGTSYSVVYVMTMYNTNIQWNVAFVLWALVQPYTMVFPKFIFVLFLTLSCSKNPTACILLSIKGIKEECLTLKTKKGKFLN